MKENEKKKKLIFEIGPKYRTLYMNVKKILKLGTNYDYLILV